jgi:ATP-dependent protease ClpP protease subunit
VDKIEKDTDRNFFMSAEEAKAYRIVDKVIAKLEPLKEKKPEPVPIG